MYVYMYIYIKTTVNNKQLQTLHSSQNTEY